MVKKSAGAALVTGAAKRVGKAIALGLAESGCDIALHYHRSKSEAEKTAREIRKTGRLCELFSCDLTSQSSTALLIKQVHETFSHFNVLINSASIFDLSMIRTTEIKDLEKNLAIHLKAPLILSRDFANICRSGCIINMVDTRMVQNQTNRFAYLLTKKCFWEFTQMAALEFAPEIRVNAVAPGFILPPQGQDQKYLKNLRQTIPLKRQGDVADVVRAVQFLLENPYLTGQLIFVDGGEHLI